MKTFAALLSAAAMVIAIGTSAQAASPWDQLSETAPRADAPFGQLDETAPRSGAATQLMPRGFDFEEIEKTAP